MVAQQHEVVSIACCKDTTGNGYSYYVLDAAFTSASEGRRCLLHLAADFPCVARYMI